MLHAGIACPGRDRSATGSGVSRYLISTMRGTARRLGMQADGVRVLLATVHSGNRTQPVLP